MEQFEKGCNGLERFRADFKPFVGNSCDWERVDAALALIRQQQERIKELEAAQQWISVKDRLPRSMANKVLVYVQHEDLVGYIGFGHYEKFNGEEMWYDLERGEQFAKNGYIVTHWMPLPEPPKEGSTDENHA
jgi:hypothetical protein